MAHLLMQCVQHHFPRLRERLDAIVDPRSSKGKNYTIAEVVFSGVAMFLLRQESRNKFNQNRRDINFQKQFRTLFGFRLPHMDTVDGCFRELDPAELEKLKVALVKSLITRKVLSQGKIDGQGSFKVAIDATGVNSSKAELEGSVHKTSKNGIKTFTRMVLEAKIVTSSGFSISVATEWIQNKATGRFDKQDCELKAFKRLAEKLKKSFPKLKVMILADGLYLGEPFLKLCQEKGYDYFVVWKDKKLSTLWDKVDAELVKKEAEGCLNICSEDSNQGKVNRVYEWVNDLDYKGHKISWTEMNEKRPDGKNRFVFASNLTISRDNVGVLVKTGRLRWAIEDSFNTQKHRGFGLQHKFSRHSFKACQNYYTALQIAHIFEQLVTLSNKMKQLLDHSKETIIHLWSLVAQALTFLEALVAWPQPIKRTKFSYKK